MRLKAEISARAVKKIMIKIRVGIGLKQSFGQYRKRIMSRVTAGVRVGFWFGLGIQEDSVHCLSPEGYNCAVQ